LQRDPEGGGLVFVEPQTQRSRRTIPRPRSVASSLRAHRTHQLEERAAAKNWADPRLVFASRVGTPLSPRNDYRAFRALAARAGLRPVRLHDLRHTAASLLLSQGVPARVVMEVLGHSQISVTLNTYSHVAPELAVEAAERMEGALWSGP
jgi:integrase